MSQHWKRRLLPVRNLQFPVQINIIFVNKKYMEWTPPVLLSTTVCKAVFKCNITQCDVRRFVVRRYTHAQRAFEGSLSRRKAASLVPERVKIIVTWKFEFTYTTFPGRLTVLKVFLTEFPSGTSVEFFWWLITRSYFLLSEVYFLLDEVLWFIEFWIWNVNPQILWVLRIISL